MDNQRMEKYNTDDLIVENIILKSKTQTQVSDSLLFEIYIKKLNQDEIKGLYCGIDFVGDIAHRKFPVEILKSDPVDYNKDNEIIELKFPSIESKTTEEQSSTKYLQSLEFYLNGAGIDRIYWCNISCIHVHINYKKQIKNEDGTITDQDRSLTVTIPTSIYKDMKTDSIIYKTTYNPFDYM